MKLRDREDSTEPAAWFRHAADRLHCVHVILANGESPGQATISLLHRAVELYLKGCLFAVGWQQEKTKNIVKLLEAASAQDNRFTEFKKIFSELNRDFRLIQYPGRDWRKVSDHFSEQLKKADELASLIRQNFPQFFTSNQTETK